MRHFAGLLVLGVAVLPSFADSFDAFTIQPARGSSCEIKPKDASIWSEAKTGAIHKAGAAGRTGSGSTLTVAFDEQNRFRLLPKSEVVISTSTRDARFLKTVDLAMSKGKVEVDLDAFPKGHQLKVQTPTAVCGAGSVLKCL